MGFAVLHLNKASGNDAAMSAHIERTIEPKNADKSRTHLNRELIEFPDGITNRTEAIQYRIDTAGIARKIGKNQVRAIRVMLSGTYEDMKQIEADGKLDEWCNDNIDWLRKTFGTENLVSAVLHLDEKSPHIHATVVPVVSGERRKANREQAATKKQYRKKPATAARLCADDVTARDKLKSYQDSYAQAMSKYGLQRGVEGSEAKHISTQQFYRDLYLKNQELRDDLQTLQEQKDIEQNELDRLKSQANTERIKESIGDLFTGSKTKRLEQENTELITRVQNIETQLAKEKTDNYQLVSKLEKEVKEKQATIDKIFGYFPEIKEKLWIVRLCETVKIGADLINELLSGKRLMVSGDLYSPEHSQYIKAERASIHIGEHPKEKNKLTLFVDNLDIYDWFRAKKREFLRAMGVKVGQKQDKKIGL